MERLAAGLAREGGVTAERPVLVDRFFEDAIEVDVDAVRDRDRRGADRRVMEHVEEAGVHSGDSACALPPQTLGAGVLATIDAHTRRDRRRARRGRPAERAVRGEGRGGLRARGQPAGQPHRAVRGQGDRACRWPGSPRGSWSARPWPSCGRPGCSTGPRPLGHVSVKEAVLPFDRFPGVDTLLGPEMRSTGEVMGVDITFGLAFAKSQMAAGHPAAPRRHRVPLARPTGTSRPASRWPASWRPWASARRDHRDRRARWRPTACRSRRWWPRWGRRARAPTPSS